MKEKIGMILDGDWNATFDLRVKKEIGALLNAGFKVSLLVKKTNSSQQLYERLGEFEIYRYELGRQSYFSRVLKGLTLIDKHWLKMIDDFIIKTKPDILHAHDFHIVPTALKVAKKYNLLLVADLHENMPAALVAYRTNFGILRKVKFSIFYNYYFWRYYEKKVLPQCCRIIVVVKEAADRLLNKYKIPPEKIVIISNTEDESTFCFDAKEADPEILDRYRQYFTVIYIGGIEPHRGIDTTLRAVILVRAKIPNLRLLIVGARKKDIGRLHREVSRLHIEENVEVVAWQPFDKVNSYLLASDVCLVPHNNFEHTQTTVPHKLFQYMICGKPVLVSDCRPLERIVKETDSGYVFKANNHNELAKKIIEIHKNPQEAKRKGENGRSSALNDYSWKRDAQRLVDLYNDIAVKLCKK